MSLFQISEDGQSWQCSRREDSKGSSDGGVAEAWEFRSALEAPIARLESLDELEGSQVGTRRFGINPMNGLQACEYKCFLKPLVIACASKIYPLTLEFACKY